MKQYRRDLAYSVVIGIAVGFILGQLVIAYELSPFISVIFAPSLFVIIGLVELKRIIDDENDR